MSLFITFEGIDGSGKSTQAQLLADRLRRQKKWHIVYAEEPGTTLLGKMLKEWLRGRDRSLTLIPADKTQLSFFETMNSHSLPDILLHAAAPRAELLAFTIARSQLVEEVILPNLGGRNIIICDRFADSTTAYQGYGRNLDLKLVEVANTTATQGIKPELTILLDLPPEEARTRRGGPKKEDQFEDKGADVLGFHRRVREGYLDLASREPERWFVIDATQPKERISEIIWELVIRQISQHPELQKVNGNS